MENVLTTAMTYVGPAIFGVAVAAAGVSDLLRYKIPNAAVVVLFVAFFPMALSVPSGAVAWSGHLLAFAGVLAVGVAVWQFGYMGAGDVKLLAVVSLWVGLEGVLGFLLLVAVAGGAVVLSLIVTRRLVVMVGASVGAVQRASLPRLLVSGEPVPYGIAIAGVALYFMLHVPLFQHIAYIPGG